MEYVRGCPICSMLEGRGCPICSTCILEGVLYGVC